MAVVVRELTDRREACVKHWLQSDGSILASLTGAPQHYQDAQGAWQDIDLTWRDMGAAYQSGANALDVHAAKALAAGGIVVSRGAASLTMVPTQAGYLNAATKATHLLANPAASPAASLSADLSTLQYSNLYPGVHLSLRLSPLGLRELLTIPAPLSLPNPATLGWQAADTWLCWTMRLGFTGLTAQGVVHGTEQAGSVVLLDTGQAIRAVLPPMWAQDADGRTIRVVRRFVQISGVWHVIYGIPYQDTQAAVYPLSIDPSTTLTADTSDGYLHYVLGAYNSVNTTSNLLNVGYAFVSGSYTWDRAFLKFALSGWSTRTLGTTTLGIYGNSKSGSPTVVLDRIADFGTLESTDWAATVQETLSSSFGTTLSAYNNLDIQHSLIAQKTTSWYAMRLKGSTEPTSGADANITYRSANTSNPNQRPKIDITYYEANTQNAPTAGDGQVALSWVLSGGLVSGDHHAIYYQANASGSEPSFPDNRSGWTLFGSTAAYNATSITVTGLTNGTQYWFKVVDVQVVSAVNYEGSVSTGQKATPVSSGVTGTGAVSLSHVTLAGAGTETFSGTGAIALQRATVAATGSETFSGPAAVSLSHVTLAGAGSETFSGTGAPSLKHVTLAGSGAETFAGTGAVALSHVTLAGTGTETFTGTGAVALSHATLAGAGSETFSATGTVTLSHLTLTGSGAETLSATSVVTTQPIALTGAGTVAGGQAVTGTGAVSLSHATVDGSGSETFAGTGAVALHAVALASSGTERFTGAGAVTLRPVALSGAASETLSGLGAITLSPIVLAGSGAERFVSISAIAFQPVALAGAGTVADNLGTGTVRLSPLALAAVGVESFVGPGVLHLQAVALHGRGARLHRRPGATTTRVRPGATTERIRPGATTTHIHPGATTERIQPGATTTRVRPGAEVARD